MEEDQGAARTAAGFKLRQRGKKAGTWGNTNPVRPVHPGGHKLQTTNQLLRDNSPHSLVEIPARLF